MRFPLLICTLLLAVTTSTLSADESANDVRCSQKTIPMLRHFDANDLLNITVKSPAQLQTLEFTFEGTDNLKDIESVQLFRVDEKKVTPIGRAQKPAKNLKIKVGGTAENYVLRCTVSKTADLKRKIDAQCVKATFAGGESCVPKDDSGEKRLRIGTVVRRAGADKCHTYRIPGMVTTDKGTLLAVYDTRYKGSRDLQGDIDVGLSRSTDGGATWEKMKIVIDMGSYGGKGEDENGVGDPCILFDPNTRTTYVAGLWAHGKKGPMIWHSSEKGIEPAKTGQFVIVKSTDDGKTWSKVQNITPQCKNPDWKLFFQGPGAGIVMRDGTLVFPAQYRDGSAQGTPHSTMVYSKDGGKTWHVGTGAKDQTTEAQIVERNDGSLMLNMRNDRRQGRVVCVTSDLGQTWQEHSSSKKLTEPNCQAAFIRAHAVGKDGLLLFSNPSLPNERKNMTVRASYDDGETWPEESKLIYDERKGYGYSSMSMIDEETVGILYEGSGDLFFVRVGLDEIPNSGKKAAL